MHKDDIDMEAVDVAAERKVFTDRLNIGDWWNDEGLASDTMADLIAAWYEDDKDAAWEALEWIRDSMLRRYGPEVEKAREAAIALILEPEIDYDPSRYDD